MVEEQKSCRDDRPSHFLPLRVPQSAQLYREAVRSLNTTLTEPVERQEARALIAQLLGGHVKIRQESEAVYARLEMDGGSGAAFESCPVAGGGCYRPGGTPRRASAART